MRNKNQNVYTVGQVNSYIKNIFEQDYMLRRIYVSGEVSNCKYHPSGHIYFSLKDAEGTISCVMFAGSRRGLAFPMRDGDNVIVGGSISVYERDGKYQIYAKEITKEGAGLLYEKYLALKAELEEMGMFAPEYKQPIPAYVKKIGVVTAPTGAAVQDIKNIALRRNPFVQIILYPALVQGEGAADSIVEGIRRLDALNLDVLIVGRGGGSIEDLWAFNEEKVARAVFSCHTPVISAVGHETDTTIIDFVADLRAPTPSAAAELLELPLPVSTRALRLAAGVSMSEQQVQAALELAGGAGLGYLSLPGTRLKRERGILSFGAQSEPEPLPERELVLDGETLIPEAGISLICRRLERAGEIHSSLNTFFFKCENICGTITCTSRQPGDRIRLQGRGCTKKLKELFSERGLTLAERVRVPVLRDGAGPLAVCGFGVAERALPGPEDAALRIDISKIHNWVGGQAK